MNIDKLHLDGAPILITTRHSALAEWCKEQWPTAEFDPRAGRRECLNKHVIGTLPIHIAEVTLSYVHIPINMHGVDQGMELDREDLLARMGTPVQYTVLANAKVYMVRETVQNVDLSYGIIMNNDEPDAYGSGRAIEMGMRIGPLPSFNSEPPSE
jgi:hypothetical protein